jgi:hypothetical protein
VFIGRLMTDEEFRAAFIVNAPDAVRAFIETGCDLTTVEVTALLAMPADFWEQVADQVDPRLQKASLHSFSRRES